MDLVRAKEVLQKEFDIDEGSFLHQINMKDTFNEDKFDTVIESILSLYSDDHHPDINEKNNTFFFIRVVYLLVISHLHSRDFRTINNFDMNSWTEIYSEKLEAAMKIAIMK